jgi:phosphoribosylanthranilate isomerase
MSKIKICGLTRPQDIQVINEVRPDYCGFVIEVTKSSRCVSREQVKELVKGLHNDILPVGVFVDAPMELPVSLLEEGIIGMAQLHGHEDEEYITQLGRYTDKPLIKAFSIRSAEDVQRACISSADYILLDQGNGGTGKTFDWSLIPSIGRPFFLAGGLGADNLGRAITQINPWAVDLSSSLEVDGKKDADKIRQVVEICRRI